MSALPMTDGIYLGANLLVPPVPPVPNTPAPWIQLNSDGGIVAVNLDNLRDAAHLFRGMGFQGDILTIENIPEATNLNSLLQDNKTIEVLNLFCSSNHLANITGFATSASVLRQIHVEIPNLVGTFGGFSSCINLESATLILPNCTDLGQNLFAGCSKLTSLTLVAPKLMASQYLVFNCTALPAFSGDFPNLAEAPYCWHNTPSLVKFNVTWPNISNLSNAFRNSGLGADEINKILHSLPTYTSGSHVITFTGCPGAATCDPSIGTAKGWTVQI